MSASELAEASQVHANTISRLEKGGSIRASNAEALRAVFEGLGVKFITDGLTTDGGGGMQLATGGAVDPGAVARAAMDDGIAALFAVVTRMPDGGRSVVKDEALADLPAFRLNWVVRPIRDLESLLTSATDVAEEEERVAMSAAVEVINAAELGHAWP